MAPKHVRYYVGRLNLVTVGRDKFQILRDSLSSNAALQIRGQRWGFYEYRELEQAGALFQTGFLVKYKPQFEEEVAVPARHRLEDTSIENRVTAKSRFFLHMNSGVIVYHPVGNHISRALFTNRFVQVLKHALQNFFVDAEIQSIEEEFKLLDELKTFSAIHQVSVYLHPSNPSNRDVWRHTDERLRGLNATSYREKYNTDSRRGSLNLLEDEDLNQKIAMAEDGYGKVEVTGQRDGREVKISTRDNPLSILAPADDEKPEQILPALTDTVMGFLERFRS